MEIVIGLKRLFRSFGFGFAISLVLLLISESQGKSYKQIDHIFSISEGIKGPLRLTIAPNNICYIADNVKNSICRYDSIGNFKGEIIIGFSPLCIATFDGQSFYVGDVHTGKISILDNSGTLIKNFGNFEQPSDAVFDDTNLLYVVDSKMKLVSVFNSDGVFQRSFGNDILHFPTGIAFDKKNQRILVAEHGGITPADSSGPIAKIHVFDKEGQWLSGFGEYGNKDGQFTRIQGLAVDQLGRIYAVDSYQGIITVLNEQGEFLWTVGEYGSSSGQLRLPMDVLIDSRNRLWITSLNNGCTEVFDIKDLPTAIIDDPGPHLPSQSQLLQNYPNPFNPGTRIPFILERDGIVTINIYNLAGQKVRSIHLGNLTRGKYLSEGKAFYWDGKNSGGRVVASGFYFYELRLPGFSKVRQMIMLK